MFPGTNPNPARATQAVPAAPKPGAFKPAVPQKSSGDDNVRPVPSGSIEWTEVVSRGLMSVAPLQQRDVRLRKVIYPRKQMKLQRKEKQQQQHPKEQNVRMDRSSSSSSNNNKNYKYSKSSNRSCQSNCSANQQQQQQLEQTQQPPPEVGEDVKVTKDEKKSG